MFLCEISCEWICSLIIKLSLVGLFYVFQVLAYFAVLHNTTMGLCQSKFKDSERKRLSSQNH